MLQLVDSGQDVILDCLRQSYVVRRQNKLHARSMKRLPGKIQRNRFAPIGGGQPEVVTRENPRRFHNANAKPSSGKFPLTVTRPNGVMSRIAVPVIPSMTNALQARLAHFSKS
jgi:hypothetical protein